MEEELDVMYKRLESSGLRTHDLTGNDLAKDHLRHLVSIFILPLNCLQISIGEIEIHF